MSFIKANRSSVRKGGLSTAATSMSSEYANVISNPEDDRPKQDGKHHVVAIDEEESQEEALTVKTFLQLVTGQGSIKLIQRYLEEHFGQQLGRAQNDSIYKAFVAFVQDLPLALWRDRSHKDKLLEALRKQLFVDQLDRITKS